MVSMRHSETSFLQIPGVEKVGFSRAVPGLTFNNNAFFNDEDPEKEHLSVKSDTR